MRGIRVVGAAALVACAAASGCVPSRDNPNDPQNAPVAHLTFGTLPAGSSCQTDVGWTQIWASSRGRCIALDARATVAPHGRPLSQLHFSWFYLTPVAGQPPQRTDLVPGTDFTITAPGLAVLTPALLHAVTPNRTITFGVDADAGEAQAALLLQNATPIAVADPLRILPLGGYPWAPGPYIVPFTARAQDDDGDGIQAVQWSWRDPATGAAMQSTAPTITLTVDSSTATDFEVTFSVSDGAAWSRPVSAELRIAAGGAIWSAFDGGSGISAPTYVERLDAERKTLSLAPPATTGNEVWFASYLGGGAQPRMAFLGTNVPVSDEIVLTDWPNGTPIGTRTVLASNIRDGRIVGDPVAPGAWVLEFSDAGAHATTVYHELLDGSATALTNDGTVAPIPAVSTPSVLRVDAAGNGWVAFSGTAALAVVEPGAQGASRWIQGSGPVLSLDARPADSAATVWALESTAGSFAIEAFTTAASAPSLHVEAPLEDARALAFAGSDSLWIAYANRLRLIDVPTLLVEAAAGAPQALEDSTLVDADVGGSVSEILGDPVRGVWGRTSALPPTGVRVDEDGNVQLYGIAHQPQVVDPAGQLWLGTIDGPSFPLAPVRGEELDQDGVVLRLPRGGPTRALVDAVGGGVWRSESADTLTRYAADGSGLGTMSIPGSGYASVGIAPDGAYAWIHGLTGTPVHRFDLSTGTETPSGGVFTLPAGSFVGPACGAAAAGTQPSSSFLWMITSGGAVQTVTESGLAATHGTIPTVELGVPAFARSQRSNALCVTTQDGSGNSYLWYFTPGGSGVTTPIVTLAGTQIHDLAAGLDASGNDLCWVSTFTGNANCALASITVTGYSSAGATVHSATDTAVNLLPAGYGGHGLFAPSADQAWLMDISCSGGTQARKITFGTPTSVETLQATDALGFAEP